MRRKKALLLGLAIAFSISGLTAAGVSAVSSHPGHAEDRVLAGSEAAETTERAGTPAAASRSSASPRSGKRRPGYRRESRKRVQPPKPKSPFEIVLGNKWICFGKIEFTKAVGGARVTKMPKFELAQSPQIVTWLNAHQQTVKLVKLGTELGKLDASKRLAKAAEDLALTGGQVELLERAVAEKTEAAKDPERAAKAGEIFNGRVGVALNDDQRRRWRELGYEHSFGAAPALQSSFAITGEYTEVRTPRVQVNTAADGTYRLVLKAVQATQESAKESR